MPAKTTHIIPSIGGWAVRKEGSAKRDTNVYSTQKEAIDAARRMTQRLLSSQIVVHSRNGSMRALDVRGLPIIQRSHLKSDLGRKAIERAVSTVIRERLS